MLGLQFYTCGKLEWLVMHEDMYHLLIQKLHDYIALDLSIHQSRTESLKINSKLIKAFILWLEKIGEFFKANAGLASFQELGNYYIDLSNL